MTTFGSKGDGSCTSEKSVCKNLDHQTKFWYSRRVKWEGHCRTNTKIEIAHNILVRMRIGKKP